MENNKPPTFEVEEDIEQSKINISDNWLKRLDISLQALEHYERSLRNGCQDTLEYIEQLGYSKPHVKNDLVKIKTVGFMINEFDMVFNNIRGEIHKEKYIDLRKKLNLIINMNQAEKLYDVHPNIVKFKEEFFVVIDNLCYLRRDLITSLDHILWARGKNDEDKLRIIR